MPGRNSLRIAIYVASSFPLAVAVCSPLGAFDARGDSTPGARWGHVFVYDPVRQQVVLFGGAREEDEYLRDSWTWDGRSWTRHQVIGPPARGFSAAAFHAGRGTLVLHGGRGLDGVTYSDTWEWDGSAWRQIEAAGPYQSDHHRMVYVADQNHLVAFGGWSGQDVSGGTWVWDGGWRQATNQGPRKRAAFAMAYDADRKTVVLCGGLWLDGQYADVWEWDGRTWSPASGPYDNSSLDHHSMVYDERRHKLVVFGGKNYRYRPLGGMMEVVGGRLRRLANHGPSPRHSAGLTYDSGRGRILVYGGKQYRGGQKIALSDLWSWDGVEWQELGLAARVDRRDCSDGQGCLNPP
ncbi:MAG: hypothetical protein JSV86_13295 [Gemmatimonadota bacterium]|nr:MAG: hypothetical protein JSV86_13295 [Gemmatimonadota bacterium]